MTKPQNKGQAALAKAQREAGGRVGGRTKGAQNKITRILKEAIPEALERLGSDGQGKDGLVGWLMQVATKEPAAYLRLLDKLLPHQINGASVSVIATYGTHEEIIARMKERGLPLPPSLIDPVKYDQTPSQFPSHGCEDDDH
jgi:hypothetical protein